MAFQPGKSGNPRGRPTEHAKAFKIRQQILKAAPEIVEGLIQAAQAGDSAAGRTLLACACPPLKPIELPVNLPIDSDADLADQGSAVINALARGLLAPGQASQILTALAGIARLIELSELESRIAALETAPEPLSPRPPVITYRDEAA